MLQDPADPGDYIEIDLREDMDIGSLYLAQKHPIGDDTSIEIFIGAVSGRPNTNSALCATTPMEGFVRCDHTMTGRYIFLQIPVTAT